MVIIFARAPRPGRCKTRLIPALGALGAARTQHLLMRRALAAAGSSEARLILCGSPDTRHPALARAARAHQARRLRQVHGSLGRKMCWHLNLALRQSASVLLIGTDALNLEAQDLRTAFDTLESGADFVLQGADDGGYVLIGARRRIRGALAGVAWSSGRELQQTASRLRRQGRLQLLPPRQDLDQGRDYRRARRAGLLPALPGALRSPRIRPEPG